MSDTLNKRFELGAYISMIVLALTTSSVLVKRFWIDDYRAAGQRPDPRVAAGTEIALPAVALQQSQRTLILALSSECSYCTESAGFYRTLAAEATKRPGVKLVAVFPQPVVESRRYLDGMGLSIEAVQMPLESLKVSATPTILLVNRGGVVMQSWVGKLPDRVETEVIRRLIEG